MNARDVATSRIADQARRFPDLNIAPLQTEGLDERDAGLASAIDHAVVRRWLTLVRVIESQLSRPWSEVEAKMQAVLLVGAAQLYLLDRLPDHAVINEAVDWAKRRIRAKAGGMVNAVLRKVAGLRKEIQSPEAASSPRTQFDRDEFPLHDGRVWKLTEPVFDDQAIRRCAQQTSHPETLLARWAAQFGAEQTTAIALHSLVHAPILVHGVLNPPERDELLMAHDEPGFFVFNGDRESLQNLLRSNPTAIVQDPTSAAPVRATSDLHPEPKLIVDACAGMGTKTRQLAQVHASARIIATDISQERTAALCEQFRGHERVQVIEHNQLGEFVGRVDLLVLDVPCSNSGVLARRVEAKYRLTRETLEKVVNLQRQIIADSLNLLSDAGRLLYSTCSIETAENQQQTQWVCKWHPMQVEREQLTLPRGLPGEAARTFRDGGYFAVLRKRQVGTKPG